MKKKLHFSLFFKIISIAVIGLILTSMLTTTVATEMTKRIFIEAFTLQNSEIMQRVTQNFFQYNVQIVSIINTYRQNESLRGYMSEKNLKQQKLFSLFYDIKDYMKSAETTSTFPTYNTVTLGINGSLLGGASSEPLYSSEEMKELPITKLSQQYPNRLFYRYSRWGLSENYSGRNVIIATKQLITPYSTTSFGTLYIIINENDFYSLYESCVSDATEALVLSASDAMIVSGSDKSRIGQSNSTLLKQAKECVQSNKRYIDIEYNGKSCTLIARYLPVYDMYITNIVDKSYLIQNFMQIRPILIASYSVIILLATAMAFLVARRITQPITALISRMSENRFGKFSHINEITGSYEVRELQFGYNQMVDEIHRYIEQLMEEQHQRRCSEIAVLQMQINPHFLYNTLASIKYLSWQGNKEGVAETINALIRLLQGVVGQIDEVITIAEELENLKSYVAINHVRYGEDIQVYYNIDPDCMQASIPRLTLQPFIENSFFHAFQIKKQGTIHIFIKRKNEYLICEIIDNGDGMECVHWEKKQPNSSTKHFSGIGISNVDERLKLIYGTDCGVSIISKKGVGTTVTISIKYSQTNPTNE